MNKYFYPVKIIKQDNDPEEIKVIYDGEIAGRGLSEVKQLISLLEFSDESPSIEEDDSIDPKIKRFIVVALEKDEFEHDYDCTCTCDGPPCVCEADCCCENTMTEIEYIVEITV